MRRFRTTGGDGSWVQPNVPSLPHHASNQWVCPATVDSRFLLKFSMYFQILILREQK